MRHIPRNSRIFIGLVAITFLLTYLALKLSYEQKENVSMQQETIEHAAPQPKVIIDTSDWKSYQDKTYPFTFSYPKNWTIKTSTNPQKFYDVTLNPGPKNPDMHIYISKAGYFGLDGLKQTPYMIDGQKGFSVFENLIGIKIGEYYYTFDGSSYEEQSDEFAAVLSRVKFQ